MAFFVADRVKETTTSTGTGTIDLAGAESGFQSFVTGVGNGNTTYYAIIDASNETWEVGVGTVTNADPDTLSRDTILASSNAGSAVNFGAGEKSVFVTQPSDKAVYKDSDSDNVTIDKVQLVAQAEHPSYLEGLLWYDTVHNTLNYYGDEPDLIHEVGMEEHQKVYNNSGVTINKGEPMYFSGNFNGYPTVGKADATDVNKYNAQGLAGHDIENNSYGYLITAGLVEDLDTSGLTAGQNFFVGLTPGSVQNSSPTYPNYPMCLGWVVNSDASSGILLVNQQNHSVNSFRVRTDTHIGGDLIIDGDLTVVGSQTVASSTNIETGAPFLYLNSGDSIGEANTTFTGSGLDDAYLAGHFSGTASTTYYVKIDATGTPDTFSWSKDNFSTTEATGVAITGGEQTLDNGIKIDFGATTGHTLNDVWSGTATPVDVDTGIWSNRNTGGTGVGYTHVGMFFDVTDSKFKLVDEYDPEPTGVINTGDSSYSAGSLVVDSVEASSASISGNITVTGTVDGRDIAADGSKLDGIESGATADQTASEILTLIKTVDGSGSGLDADTLDGINSGSFLRSDQSDSTSGTLTVQTLSVGTNSVGTTSDIALSANVAINAENSLSYGLTDASAGYYRWMFGNTSKTSGISGGTEKMRLDKDGNLTLSGTVDGRDIATDGTKLDGIESGATADQTASEILTAIKTVDGAGSGLDADLIDGVHGPFVKDTGTDFNGQYPMVVRTAANAIYSNAGIQYTGSTDTLDVSGSINIAGNRVLTVNDEGSGNGLDADTVDGLHASEFLRSNATDTFNCNGNVFQFDFDTSGRNSISFNRNGTRYWQFLHDNSGQDFNVDRVTGSGSFKVDGNRVLTTADEGSGSGLDADTVDTLHASQFLRSDADDTATGLISFSNKVTFSGGTDDQGTLSPAVEISSGTLYISHDEALIVFDQGQKSITSNDGQGNFQIRGGHDDDGVHIDSSSGTSGLATVSLNTDGQDGIIFLGVGPRRNAGSAANFTYALSIDEGLNGLKWGTGSATYPDLATKYTVWHSGNDGSGSGLNADTLDGQHASAFVAVAGDTMSGNLDMNDNNVINIGKINFENHEGSDYGANGDVMFDENFYSDSEYGTAWTSTNGGGLAVYNEDGWGRILTDRNSQYHTANFHGLILNRNTTDVLNFTANSTNDNRGISFNSRTALSADYNDGYLRLNNASEFGNGVYTPKNLRSADLVIGDDGGVFGRSSVTSGGPLAVSRSSNPYLTWHEGATRRFYIQYLTTDNAAYYNNEESTQHIFNGTGTTVRLLLRTSGTSRGSVYADNSNNIGFLDSDGNWAYRHQRDSNHRWYINNSQKLYLGSTEMVLDQGTSSTLTVKCDDGGRALIRANGDSQGTGAIEVGQSGSYGGGISYNGDGSPAFVNGEAADRITFYRLSNGTRSEVFSYSYNDNNVEFNGELTIPNQIRHQGDTNTYMQFHAADQWRVVTGGSERLEVNNTNTTLATNLVINTHVINMDLNNLNDNAIELTDVRSSTWPFEFNTNSVGNDNPSGFWVGSNGYPDMRLRRENSTVRALISSWERSYVSNGFSISGGTLDMNNNDIVGVDQIIHEGDSNTYSATSGDNPNSDEWDYLNVTSIKNKIGNSGLWFNAYDAVGTFLSDARGQYCLMALTYDNGDADDAHWLSGDADRVIGAYMFDGQNHFWHAGNASPLFADTTVKMKLDNNGSLEAVSFKAISDKRLKENLTKLKVTPEELKNIHGYTYNFIGEDENIRNAGILAQDVLEILPEAVSTSTIKNPKGESSETLQVDYNAVIAVLVNVVNELTSRVGELEAKIDSGS